MITPEEVGALSRPISQHIDRAQILSYITEVEQLIVRPTLGEELYNNIRTNQQGYEVLMNGGEGVSGGLRKAVAYHVYARIIKQGATIATRFGAVEKVDEYSYRIEHDKKDAIFRECSNIADAYMAECIKYAKEKDMQDGGDVASSIRRTAYIVGD